MTLTQTRTDFPNIRPDGYDSLEEWAADSDYEYRHTDYWGYGWYQIDQEGAPPVELPDVYAEAMHAAATCPDRVFLTGFGTFAELGTSVKAILFGEMVKRAEGVIEQYHGDLWHDALKVDAITGPCRFWWGPRESGTHMGEGPTWKGSATLDHARGDDTCHLYWIELTCEDRDRHRDTDELSGAWYATFTMEAR